jgi:4-carboxymuconolactone decarboxylase
MKRITFLVSILMLVTNFASSQYKQTLKDQKMNRTELSKQKYIELFGQSPATQTETDPELMDILRKFIFGEVFYAGNLKDKQRELITIVILTAQQTISQLKGHTQAALNIGVTPLEIREAVYQCAPMIGFPKTLNAVSTINEVFTLNNIRLPLENEGTVSEEDRFSRGSEIQYPLYGDEIKEKMKNLPDSLSVAVPKFLTEMCFGDFYTRKVLDTKTRELLMLCVLVTIGAEPQIKSHALGNLKAGNSKETILAAMVHCIPYIGFPAGLNAINIIKDL